MKPEDIEAIPIPFEQVFGDLEQMILGDIVRRIKVAGEVTASADWQMTMMEQLGYNQEDIRIAIQDALAFSDREIDSLYQRTLKQEYVRNATLYSKLGYVPTEGLEEEFDQILSALAQQTKGSFRNITQTMGFVTKQNGKLVAEELTEYMKRTYDDAVNGILTGAFDYNTAIKRVSTELSNSGVRWIDYGSGTHNRLTVAARRSVMTGFNQAVSKMNEDTANALGTEHFEVSWHSGARPEHMLWQGRIYSKQELVSVCGLGSAAGLCGANCYHHYLPFVPGASIRTYTDEQLEAMNAEDMKPRVYNGKEYTAYEAKQRQRSLETSMRAHKTKAKLLEEGGADEADVIDAKARYRATSAEYTQFSKSMGLPQQRERVKVFTTKADDGTMGLELIFKSLGAKGKNYEVLLPDGEVVHLTENTKLIPSQVIAGKRSARAIDEVLSLIQVYGGSEKEWAKIKGTGYVDFNGESHKAEIHWYQEPSVGKVELKVKPQPSGELWQRD